MAEQSPFDRSPWLAKLVEQPELECSRLLAGLADVGDLARADASAVVRALAEGLPASHKIVVALDKGLGAWLEAAREAQPGSRREQLAAATRATEAFRAIGIVSGPALIEEFWRRYARWLRWAEKISTAGDIDVRRTFLTMLAQTQARIPEGRRHDRLPFWLRLCSEAGRSLPDKYVEIGLLGLRRMVPADDGSQVVKELSAQERCVVGLVNWVSGRDNKSVATDLALHWNTLKLAYPSSTETLERLFKTHVEPRKDELNINLLSEWRRNVVRPVSTQRQPLAGKVEQRPFPKSASPESSRKIDFGQARKTMMGLDWVEAKKHAYELVREARANVRGGKQIEHLSVAASVFGNAALHHSGASGQEASKVARELAMLGLAWEPDNAFHWSLWRDALSFGERDEDAMVVGWEGVRRFPHNPAMWTGLARLLMWRRKGRDLQHAIAMLEMTFDWSWNPYAFAMMVQGMTWTNRKARSEAERLLKDVLQGSRKEVFDTWSAADQKVMRSLWANMLLHHDSLKSFEEAEQIAREIIGDHGADSYSENILVRALIGLNTDASKREAISILRRRRDRNSLQIAAKLEAELRGQSTVDEVDDEGYDELVAVEGDDWDEWEDDDFGVVEIEDSDDEEPQVAVELDDGHDAAPAELEFAETAEPVFAGQSESAKAMPVAKASTSATAMMDHMLQETALRATSVVVMRNFRAVPAKPAKPASAADPVGTLYANYQEIESENLSIIREPSNIFAQAMLARLDEAAFVPESGALPDASLGQSIEFALSTESSATSGQTIEASDFAQKLVAALNGNDKVAVKALREERPQEKLACNVVELFVEHRGNPDGLASSLAKLDKKELPWLQHGYGPASRSIRSFIRVKSFARARPSTQQAMLDVSLISGSEELIAA